MSDKTLLSIDCGTQSLRALLFSTTGDLLGRAQVEYEPYFSEKPGWAEQDPEVFWDSLCRACQQLRQDQPDLFTAVAGVGVTTQRASMINVDSKGQPLRPAIIWLDQRKAVPPYHPRGIIKLALKAVGKDEAILRLQAEGKVNWIRQNQPGIWRATHKYLQVSGFLNHRLTGVFADSAASQIGHIPFHYKKIRWARRYELPARFFPVETDKLPEIVPPGDPIGTISADAAEQTGLAVGLPVIACGSDKGCETIGAGVMEPAMVSLSFGTTATVQTTTAGYCEPIRFMPPYPAPIPGYYNPEVEIFRGFWMITWFKKEFAFEEVQEAKNRGIAAEMVLDRHLSETDPGAMGLVVQPYWSPGLEHPAAKGAMIGFGDVHTKAHIYRAVIEGLGYGLRDGLRKMEKAVRTRVTAAAVSGGAAQSDEICKIAASIFNLPMVRGKTHETSGLGAAIVTAVGVKLYDSFSEAIKHMVTEETRFEPDPAAVQIYDQLYERVYQRMYTALAPLYRDIREITGYPE